PITRAGKQMVAELGEERIPIAWWPRKLRYSERLSPGTKFADIIGEIDPAKLAGGTSMSAEEALHFGLIPRMHRGIFAMNEIPEQEAGIALDGAYPVLVPPFMKEIIEQVSMGARKSKYIDHQSGVSARFSIANYRTMVASARQRAVRLGERPAVPRISDLGHLYSSSLGKLELDMMGSHQMSERQVLEAILAEAIKDVFEEYVDKHGLGEIVDVFGKGV